MRTKLKKSLTVSYEGKMLKELGMPALKEVEHALLRALLRHNGVIKEFGSSEEVVSEIANDFGLRGNQHDGSTSWRHNGILNSDKEGRGMKKTQIYLDEEEYSHLRQEAYQQHKTMSSVIRGVLAQHWRHPTIRSRKTVLRQLIGLGRCGAKDVSVRHDDYLAGLES